MRDTEAQQRELARKREWHRRKAAEKRRKAALKELEPQEPDTALAEAIIAGMADEIQAMRDNKAAREDLYRRAQIRGWQKANPEKCKQYAATYYQKHKKKINAYVRKRRRTNPEFRKKELEKNRRWRANCSEEMRRRAAERNRRYYAAHKDELNAKRRARRKQAREEAAGNE